MMMSKDNTLQKCTAWSRNEKVSADPMKAETNTCQARQIYT